MPSIDRPILSGVADYDAHLAALFACRACPGVEGVPVAGPVRGSKVLLVGQAPGPREGDARRPFAYTAGQRLFAWFATIGASEERVRESIYIAAVIRCFPGRSPAGGDRVPTPEEIARCAVHLDREIEILEPELVIAVGTLAAATLLGESSLAALVGRKHRASRAGRSFDVVVLPHPSGRSTWLNRPEHRQLLEKSLRLIARHRAWKRVMSAE